MNTKTTKFLAVLAVLAMAFAVLAIVTPADQDSDAAAGDSSAPLGDGAVKYDDGAVSLGKVKFTPYVQESAGASFSNSKLTLTGFYVANHPTAETSGWKNIGFLEAGWADTPVISFALSETTYTGEEAYYYVFQQNSLLTGGYKVTTISVASGAFDKATGANPSFEFALDTTADVVVKIIKSAEALTIEANATDFAKYTASANVAVFTIDDNATTLKGSETTVITEASGKITAATKNLVIAKSVAVSVGTAGQTNTNDLIGIDMSTNGQNIYIKSGATLTINLAGVMAQYTAAYGILHTNNNLLIQGEGLNSDLVINDATTKASDWKANQSGSARNETSSTAIGILEGNTGTAKNLNINKVDVAIDGREADCSFGLGPKGAITIENGARVDIKCSNRAIQNDTSVTVKGSSTVSLAGGEAGIKGGSSGTITIGTSGSTTDKSTLSAAIIQPKNGNGGADDRYGILVRNATTVYEGATLTVDAYLQYGTSAKTIVKGVMNVNGSQYGGYSYTSGDTTITTIPSGLVIVDTVTKNNTTAPKIKVNEFDGDNYVFVDGGTLNIAKGASVFAYISSKDGITSLGTDGMAIFGKFTSSGNVADAVIVSSDMTITKGSINIKGGVVSTIDGVMHISGKAEISGTLDANIVIDSNASVTVPAGETLTIAEGKKITVTDGAGGTKTTINVVGEINGSGTIVSATASVDNIAIYTANPDSLSTIVASNLKKDISTEPSAVSLGAGNIDSAARQAEVQNLINNNLICYLPADITIAAGYELTIPESSTINLNGYTLTIAAAVADGAVAADLMVKGGKIVDYEMTGITHGTAPMIVVSGILEIDSADVCVDVKVTPNVGYVAIISAKNMTIKGELTSDVSVGYGNTMTLDGVTVPNAKKVQAYGTLIFEGNNYVNKGANVYVYAYGKAEVNGNLYVYGAMNVKSSLTITGTVEVSNDDGGATFTNTGMIFNSGTFNVLGYKSSTAVNQNLLIAGYTYNYGTMKITGKATGVIYDLGDLIFNGTAGSAVDDTVVVLMDGVTFKLSSAAGYITVKDDDSFTSHPDAYESDMVTMKKKVKISAGNTAVLYNAKNVTFTETVKITVKEGTWTDETVTKETANIKCFVSNLEMSGSLAAIDDKATSAYTVVTVSGDASSWTVKTGCTATVSGVTGAKFAVGDAAVGKNVRLQMGADVNVTGTLSVVAKTSLVEATDASNYVGVTGTIIVGYECGKTAAETGSTAIVQGILTYTNSTYYIIQDDDANDTYYYTTFANAVEASTLAYDKDLMMLGTNKLSSGDVVIPADVTVTMMASSTLNIGAKATVTVSEGALLNGVNGTIIVDGMLTVNDKNSGLRFNTGADRFQYQVITENGNIVKYSGILGALNNAVAGDVITMVQSKVIKESFTIPEGVKLVIPTKVVLAVGSTSDKVKVTVNGELQLERSAYFLKSSSTATTPVTTNLKEVELVINGAVIVDDTATVSTTIVKDDYVEFAGKVDGRATTFFSNIEYAGDNVSEGTVTIYGQVVGDVVSFSKGANVSDNIVIVYDETSRSATNPSSINVGTLTLDGVTLIVPYALDTTYTFTGTIVAADAVDYASVACINANGFTLRTYEEVSGTGSVDYLYLNGAINGKMAIQDGIVTVYNTAADVDLYAFTTSTDYFAVGEDATLVVPKDTGAEIGGSVSDEYPAVIDGILYIEGSEVTFGYVEVSGVISVNDTTKVDIALPMILTGSLIVNDTDDKPAKVNVKRTSVTIDATTYYCFGSIVLGDEPGSLGSDASIVGPVSLDAYTYILVYSGDLSEAQINWNSATKESQIVYTEFYINDELYATAIAANSTDVRLISFTELDPSYTTTEYTAVLDHKFTLVGLDTSKVIAQNKDVSSTSTYWYYDADKYVTTYKVIGDYDEIYIDLDAALVYGTITVGTGLSLYIDGQLVDVGKYYPDEPSISVGIHNVMVQVQSGYTGDNVTIKFNGAPVTAGTIIVTADMDYFVLAADGATPYTPEPTPEPEKESEWTVTTILLCVLVVLIAIMAVIVALRLNRN